MEKEQLEFIKKHNVKLTINGNEFKKHFSDDREPRHVFNCTLKANGRQYTFEFGQSIARGCEEPSIEDVLECLQKYDVGTFEDFCDNYGYDAYDYSSKRIYKAVCREYEAMCRLFGEDALYEMAELFC